MFGSKPSQKWSSPLEHNDHPELDTSEFLDVDMKVKYQSVIGSLQWEISIGRMDISVAVMTLSSFRELPRRGHLERAKRVVDNLSKMEEGGIRYCTELPDYSTLQRPEYKWVTSVYGEVSELVPKNVQAALGEPVIFTHYFDANLFHDKTTGRSVTGILHMINKTLIYGLPKSNQLWKQQHTGQSLLQEGYVLIN